jgi:hypothetical protein
MRKKIKTAYRLLTYGFKAKLQLGIGAVFVLLGVVITALSPDASFLGGLYIVLGGMFGYQIFISLDVSTLVQTSAYKRKLQTSIPLLSMAPVVYLSYTIIALVWGCRGADPADAAFFLLLLAGVSSILLVYLSVVYKFFLIMMVMMMVVICGVSFSAGLSTGQGAAVVQLPFGYPAAVLLGYVMITAAYFLAYGLSRLLYKREFSKYAFGAAMRKYLK